MADETTPVLEPRVPTAADGVVYYQDRGDGNLPRMIGNVHTRPAQPLSQPRAQRPTGTYYSQVQQQQHHHVANKWTQEMRMHCWMFAGVTILLLLLLASISVFIYLLFKEDGTFTKIKRMTDTGDYMVQRLNDSGIIESVFVLAATWETGNYTENAAVALDRAGENIGRLMDTLETMDWNSFKLVANATLYEVQAIIDILEAFISGGSFQISIPIPVRPP